MFRHVPKSQNDPGLWIPGTHDPGFWRILDIVFLFHNGILEILVPVTAALPWDPMYIESRTKGIMLGPGDPGSSLSKLLWDLADLLSYPTIMSLCFEHSLHPMKFGFWFPHMCALDKLEHCLEFEPQIDSTIPC